MPDLVVENLVKEYSTPGEALRVLDGVNFSLDRGQSLAIMGPSGSGKSTLLAILGSLEPPTSGSVHLVGQDPFALSDSELATFRGERVGFVFQEHHLLPQCTALENVLVPFLARRSADDQQQQRARDMLQRVGLADRLDHCPAELSGGERQRVAIARALVREPTLILADEPTGNLDRKTARTVSELLAELSAQYHAILVVVTHSRRLAGMVENQVELDAGQLVPVA
jgi:lipoprotein-releasing system ATP-binding protein